MVFFPELERIEVDTPPPSPIPFIDPFDTDITKGITSPTKRVRSTSGNPGPCKRRKKETACSPECERDEATLQPYDNNEEWLQTSEPSADNYTEFVAAVLERRAGFYPLSDELYIAQGWDNKSNYVKVSLDLVHQQSRLTNL